MQRQSTTIHVAQYPTEKVAFWTDYPCSWHDDVQERECKRTGKHGIRSFAYRIRMPTATSCLRLQRIWNPDARFGGEIQEGKRTAAGICVVRNTVPETDIRL